MVPGVCVLLSLVLFVGDRCALFSVGREFLLLRGVFHACFFGVHVWQKSREITNPVDE